MSDFFASLVKPYEDPWYRYDRVISLITRHIPLTAGITWLDLGCQIGQFIYRLQHSCAVRATGIDQFEPDEIAHICKTYFNVHITRSEDVFTGTWRYLSRDLGHDRFDLPEKFQCISALELIEHIIDTDQFIEACRRHLEPNGYLIISTPNINSLRNRILVPLGKYPAALEFRNIIHHVRLYNVAALTDQMRKHGFEPIRIAGVSFLPARMLSSRAIRTIDPFLSNNFPTLCGNIIGIFRRSN